MQGHTSTAVQVIHTYTEHLQWTLQNLRLRHGVYGCEQRRHAAMSSNPIHRFVAEYLMELLVRLQDKAREIMDLLTTARVLSRPFPRMLGAVSLRINTEPEWTPVQLADEYLAEAAWLAICSRIRLMQETPHEAAYYARTGAAPEEAWADTEPDRLILRAQLGLDPFTVTAGSHLLDRMTQVWHSRGPLFVGTVRRHT